MRCLSALLLLFTFAHADVAADISDLANPAIEKRQEAERKLWKAGQDAVESLSQACHSTDPEISTRAAAILRKIKLRVRPDSPAEVLELVEQYFHVDTHQKEELLEKLANYQAYEPLLLLSKTDPDFQKNIQNSERLSNYIYLAARMGVYRNDPSTMKFLIKEFSDQTSTNRIRAWLAKCDGRADEEIKRSLADPSPHAWRYTLALYSVTGKYEDAVKLAAQHDLSRFVNYYHLLDGNPLPYITDFTFYYTGQSEDLDQENHTEDVSPHYKTLVINHWMGEPYDLTSLAAIKKLARSHDESSICQLMSLHFTQEAEKHLRLQDDFEYFAYLINKGRDREALQILKLNPDKPDFDTWLSERFQKIIKEPNGVNMEVNEVSFMIEYLEQRGVFDPIKKTVAPAILKLADQGSEYTRVIIQKVAFSLASSYDRDDNDAKLTNGEFLLHIAPTFTDRHAERWDILLSYLNDQNRVPEKLWKWINEIDKTSELIVKFRRLIVAMQIARDWHNEKDWLWEQLKAENAKNPNNEILVQLLAYMANINNDQETIFSLQKDKETLNNEYFNSLQWQKFLDTAIAPTINVNVQQRDIDYEMTYLMQMSIAKRATGKTNEANELEKKFLRLSLGNFSNLCAYGAKQSYIGDFTKQMELYETAYRIYPESIDTSENSELKSFIKQYADTLLMQKQFMKANAAYEALLLTLSNKAAGASIYTLLRNNADMAHAFGILEKNRARAISMLKECFNSAEYDASLADNFFPNLHILGLHEQCKDWLDSALKNVQQTLKLFPDYDNGHNSYAWLASRAQLYTDEAEKHSQLSLQYKPWQAAYLDTMAETQFAKGNRTSALNWSKKSLVSPIIRYEMLPQYFHYLRDPLPK